MTRILLLRPPENNDSSFVQMYTLNDSLGIGYLAAYLRIHGVPVEILDAEIFGMGIEETIEEIKKRDFDLLGISVISPLVLPQALRIAEGIKAVRKDVHITMGGEHPTSYCDSILMSCNALDTIVRFEGEETLLDLASKIHATGEWEKIPGIAFRKVGEVKITPLRPLISDLDTLPFPARDTLPLLLEKGGIPLLAGSRGCPYRCSFCTVRKYFKRPEGSPLRTRSPENVVREMKFIRDNFGCEEVWFVDENFIRPGRKGKEETRRILSLMEEEGVRLKRIDFFCRTDSVVGAPEVIEAAGRQGAKLVFLGIEAGVQRILDIYNKGTTVAQNKDAVEIVRKSGAELRPEFIFFNPWITFVEVKETLSLLEQLQAYDPYVLTSILTIRKDTELGEAIENGELEVFSVPSEEMTDFDRMVYIPYEITDVRARAVFHIVVFVIAQLKPLLDAANQLERFVRIHRKRLNEAVLTQAAELLKGTISLTKLLSLDIFKEVVGAVEGIEPFLSWEEGSISDIRKKLSDKYREFSRVMSFQLENAMNEMEVGVDGQG